MKSHSPPQFWHVLLGFGIAGFLVLIIAAIFYFASFSANGLSSDPSDWAFLGDYLGGVVGGILAFGAFAVLLLSLHIQRQEMHEATSAMQAQSCAIDKQNFDNMLFQMLHLHHEIVSHITDHNNGNPVAGRAAINTLTASPAFRTNLATLTTKIRDDSTPPETALNGIYEEIYREIGPRMGHYFRNLYRIMKFIDDSKTVKDGSEKRSYTGIVRAQLSTRELQLLLLNGLSARGKKFKPLLEKYAMFENIGTRMDSTPWRLIVGLYDLNAFGDQKNEINRQISKP